MSIWIVVSALLALAVLHSALGERLILAPLFAAPFGPTPIGRTLTRRTLRFAWHLTSVAWIALAAIAWRGDGRALSIVGAMLAVSAVIALVGGRGQHFAWALFALGALGALVAPRAALFARTASVLGAALFAAVALLHFAWASGVKWGIGVAIPRVGEAPAFAPGAAMTALVAVLFAVASALFAVAPFTDARWVRWLCVAGAVVCGLRALGDFRLVGLSKRERSSAFARWDDALFTPLCVVLSACFATVAAGES